MTTIFAIRLFQKGSVIHRFRYTFDEAVNLAVELVQERFDLPEREIKEQLVKWASFSDNDDWKIVIYQEELVSKAYQ